MSEPDGTRLRELAAEVQELHDRDAYDRDAFARIEQAAIEAAGPDGGERCEFVYRWADESWVAESLAGACP